MRILRLVVTFLYIAEISAQGYGGSWSDLPSPPAPAFQRPVDVLTDVINELGVRILQEYGETRNSGNVAFSPTGIGFVLAALYEGSAGPGNEQIAHVLGLPRDKDITRIGLRDIHRRLRSYLSPDGFLGGLTLNRENTKLRPEYEDILKFLGFDLPSGNDGTNATNSSTSVPETTAEVTTALSASTPSSSSTTGTEVSESSTEESTSTLATSAATSEIETDVLTTTEIAEEVAEASTEARKEETTTNTNPEETTTLKGDPDSMETESIQEISASTTTNKLAEITEQVSSTVEILDAQSTTVSITTPVPKTTESMTTVVEVSSRVTEASSAMPPIEISTESLSSTESTTPDFVNDAPSLGTKKPEVQETTSASTDEVAETTKSGSTTLQPEDNVTEKTTTALVSEIRTTTESTTTVSPEEEESDDEVLDTSESESEVESSSSNPEESEEELTTTSMEESSTLESEETLSNEVVSDSTTARIDTTTVDDIDEIETIANTITTSLESENLPLMENKKLNDEVTTSSALGTQAPKRRRIRRIRIRDPVVRTLLYARSAEPEVKVTARSDLADSKENETLWINRIVESSSVERNADDISKSQTILENKKAEEDEELAITGTGLKNRGTRSSRGYFSNFPDFPSFPVYPDFPGFPEETSWTRKVGGGWRVHSPKTDESSEDSSELTFLLNGEEAAVVSAATYTVVLPFAFLPTLQALALEFPLDDPRYNILLLLPTDRDGTRRLARDLGNVGLRELRKELQPAWVRAMIPSFMLKGFVTLTPFLQRLGIRDVFEPRDADLSPMTEEVGVYARDVQQSIGVNIRNYMKPDRTHSRNGLFERAGPVSFIAEHPFLFFIIDAETGVSLIAGRIENPLNSRIL